MLLNDKNVKLWLIGKLFQVDELLKLLEEDNILNSIHINVKFQNDDIFIALKEIIINKHISSEFDHFKIKRIRIEEAIVRLLYCYNYEW